MSLWQQLRVCLREMPRFYAARLHQWARDQHRPFDLRGDGTGPAVCSLDHRTPWPCKEWIAADERLRAVAG